MLSTKKSLILLLCLALLFSCMSLALATDQPELRTVTILCRKTFNQYWDLEDDREGNKTYQVFVEELAKRGIKVEYEFIENSAFSEVVQTRMAAQVDLPDIIADTWAFADEDIVSWGNNGLLVELNEPVAKYDDDGSIFKFYDDKVPGIRQAQTTADGELFWFSYLNSPTFVMEDGTRVDPYSGNTYALSIRKDWLDAVGIDYKIFMTPDELFDALTSFQANDVNGNGVKDEVLAINIASFRNGVANGFGLAPQQLAYVDKSDKHVKTNFDNPAFKDYIQYMQRLYQAGLFDTSALGAGMIDQMIADNKVAANFHYSAWTSYEATIGSAPNAEYAPFILDDDAGANGWNLVADPVFGTYCHYIVTSQVKDIEAVIDLFDYIYTDEYAMLNQYGIEGYSFEYDANGIPQKKFTEEMQMNNFDGAPLFFTVGLYAYPAINTGYCVLTAPETEDFTKLKNAFLTWYFDHHLEGNMMSDSIIALATTEEAERLGEIENVLHTYSQELLTDLILGNRSLDDLQTYLDEMKTLGLDDYLKIVQDRFDRVQFKVE